MKIKKCLLYVLAILFLGACGDDVSENPNGTSEDPGANRPIVERVAGQPEYLVAMEASYAPFAFRDELGYVIGYERDLLEAIGRVENFNVKIIARAWDGLFDTLSDGTRDIVGSGVIYTPERAKTMDASQPVYTISYYIVVPEEGNIRTRSDLSGKKIAVQADTSMEDYLSSEEADGLNLGGLVPYPTMFLAFNAMLRGEVEGVYGNSGVLDYYIGNLPESYYSKKLRIIPLPEIKSDSVVFYVDKGNKALLDKINSGLDKLKQSGEFAKINEDWFGHTREVGHAE